jgi:hypothetical protein
MTLKRPVQYVNCLVCDVALVATNSSAGCIAACPSVCLHIPLLYAFAPPTQVRLLHLLYATHHPLTPCGAFARRCVDPKENSTSSVSSSGLVALQAEMKDPESYMFDDDPTKAQDLGLQNVQIRYRPTTLVFRTKALRPSAPYNIATAWILSCPAFDNVKLKAKSPESRL